MHDPNYPCRTGIKSALSQVEGDDKPSALARCNPMHDSDYPCSSRAQVEGDDKASAEAQCNPMHDPNYPCRTGIKSTLSQLEGDKDKAKDPASPLATCNSTHDPDYPCRTGVMKAQTGQPGYGSLA